MVFAGFQTPDLLNLQEGPNWRGLQLLPFIALLAAVTLWYIVLLYLVFIFFLSGNFIHHDQSAAYA
jgi:hypothetical protein